MIKHFLICFIIAIAVCLGIYVLSWCADLLAIDFFLEFGNLFSVIVTVVCTYILYYKINRIKKD